MHKYGIDFEWRVKDNGRYFICCAIVGRNKLTTYFRKDLTSLREILLERRNMFFFWGCTQDFLLIKDLFPDFPINEFKTRCVDLQLVLKQEAQRRYSLDVVSKATLGEGKAWNSRVEGRSNLMLGVYCTHDAALTYALSCKFSRGRAATLSPTGDIVEYPVTIRTLNDLGSGGRTDGIR